MFAMSFGKEGVGVRGGDKLPGDGRPEAATAAVADNWAAGPASSSRLQRSLVVAAEAKTPATAGPRPVSRR